MIRRLMSIGVVLSMLSICIDISPVWAASADSSQRQRICLNGVWDFKAAQTPDDVVPADDWTTMRVPSSWIFYGPHNFTVTPADAKSPHAWFRRTFYVPEGWEDGRRVKLQFDCVDWAHRIHVNGKLVHQSDWLGLCFDVDVTDHVRFGQSNEVAAWVERKPGKRPRNDREAGITRSVYLTSTPPVHIQYAHAIPSLEPSELRVRLRLRNDLQVDRRVHIQVSVIDNGQSVLKFEKRSVGVPAGGEADLTMMQPWDDPVIWGFGQYGRPYLYHLRTVLTSEEGNDRTDDRFGFREFSVDGPHFRLNRKPIFLKGDLIHSAEPVIQNHSVIAAFYQVMRISGMNFQRLHPSTRNFDSRAWYDVADELGHLVQAQYEHAKMQVRAGGRADDPRILQNWTSYVNAHFNHPSLVMWCPDNEHFTAPLPVENCVRRVLEEDMGPWDRLVGHIHRLDPTRPINFEHGWALAVAVKRGTFNADHYHTFNIHPYGDIADQIERSCKAVEYDGSVPIHVGEHFNSPNNVDLLRDPEGAFAEEKRRGEVFARGIAAAAKVGASAITLCSMQSTSFVGYDANRKLRLGPWTQDLLMRTDGKITGARQGLVQARWPSLSGEGTKVEHVRVAFALFTGNSRNGQDFNWFDPTRPLYTPAISADFIREAYRSLTGEEEPPLGPERAADVIVCFGEAGRPIKDAYVQLRPLANQAIPNAVATDADGTAWCRVWDTGPYEVVVTSGETVTTKRIDVTRPSFTGRPGYDHLQWIDMGGINIDERRRELAKTANIQTTKAHWIDDSRVNNGDFEFWPKNMLVPPGWDGRTHIKRRASDAGTGRWSLMLRGGRRWIRQKVQLESGEKYRLSGRILKLGGNGFGRIGVRIGKDNWLCALDGDDSKGKWRLLECEFEGIADDSAYVFCFNWRMGDKGVCAYDDIVLEKVAASTNRAMPLKTDVRVPFGEEQVISFEALSPSESEQLTDFGAEQPIFDASGRRLYFVRPADQSLWTIDLQSKERHQLVETPVKDPAISPDGNRIMYVAGQSMLSGRVALYVIADGRVESLSANLGIYENPVWHDVRTISYSAYDQKKEQRVRIDLTKNVVASMRQAMPGRWTIHPASGMTACVQTAKGGTVIKVYRADGTLQTTIRRDDMVHNAGGGGYYDPAFSPDGSMLAYAGGALQPSSDLFIMHLPTGRSRRLTHDGVSNRRPTWAPDGSGLVYESMRSGSRELWYQSLR